MSDLIFYKNRNTPRVVPSGSAGKHKPSEGPVVSRRPATASEQKTISRGDWLRVDKKGRTPGSKGGYGTGSKVRPQFNKRYSGTMSAVKKKLTSRA